jgi:cold shock protein
VAVGKVLRFDPVRGYGFIVPDGGGEDVFLHANDLLDEKYLIKPGTIVEFDVETGDRGLKASAVQITGQPATASGGPVSSGPSRAVDDSGDSLCDVLSGAEFRQEITDLLLNIEPSLTGKQILHIRDKFTRVAKSYGWVEN